MGNCTASKLAGGGEEDAVALCRERKRLLKAAVERRYALADAHAKYSHALYSVAAAINLFVTRHSTPTPILITLPSSSPPSSSSDPSFLKQTPSEPKTEAVVYRSSSCSSSSSSCCLVGESGGGGEGEGDGEMGVNGELGCGYFFPGSTIMSPPPPSSPSSPMRDFGWDFFNPFDGVTTAEDAVIMAGLGRSSDEEMRAAREEEGIPELEEEEQSKTTSTGGGEGGCENGNVAMVNGENGNGAEVVRMGEEEEGCSGCCGSSRAGGEKGLTVIDTPARERELLDALRDVEDHFIRAYDSGKDVTRMLEASTHRAPLNSGLDEIKAHCNLFAIDTANRKNITQFLPNFHAENSSKLIQAITWHRSSSSQSSSYRSFLASSSRSTTTSWAESRSDIFDDLGGMQSGSHSQTLGRLYAWEKKLYEEVKAVDETQKMYEKKCSQLMSQDAKGVESRSTDKTRAAAKDLYTRIWVAIKSAETISNTIHKLRDEELLPQLIELLQSLMRTWKIMLESHDTQNQIMFEVNTFTSPVYGKFCSDIHRFATLQLDAELQNWRACFMSYTAAQREYVEALDGWLSKFLVPEVEFYSRGRHSVPPCRVGAPPLCVICHDWLAALRRLPDKAVSHALKTFSRDVKLLWIKQGEEQRQKKKVDHLAKELDRRVLAFQKADSRVLESKLSEYKSEPDVRPRLEHLAGRKDLLDIFRKRLEGEKARHHHCIEETKRVTLNGFRTGFVNVFESLSEFSRYSFKMYDDLLIYNEKTKKMAEANREGCCIEGSQAGMDCRQLPHMEDNDS